jgi:hypothetical protein
MMRKPRIFKGQSGWWIVRYPSGYIDRAGNWDVAMGLVDSYYNNIATSTNDAMEYRYPYYPEQELLDIIDNWHKQS